MLREIQVEHLWTKERATLPVESVDEYIISFRWGMAGIYELDIRSNRIRARNPASRRKHPHCMWIAVDIEKVRRGHWEHRHPGKDERDEEAYRIHHEGLITLGKKSCATPMKLQPNARKSSVH